MANTTDLDKRRIDTIEDIEIMSKSIIKNHCATKSYKAMLAGLMISCRDLIEIHDEILSTPEKVKE